MFFEIKSKGTVLEANYWRKKMRNNKNKGGRTEGEKKSGFRDLSKS